MNPITIWLCDYTGIAAKPWLDNGYDAVLVDPQHPERIHFERLENGSTIWRIGHIINDPAVWDFLDQIKRTRDVAFVGSFPPCTHLAVSGAAHFERKKAADPLFQTKAMQVVYQCRHVCEMFGCPGFLENPVSRISTRWRQPDYRFHPWWYTAFCPADNYTKLTCLWTFGGFRMPEASIDSLLGKPDDRIHKAPPGEGRANFRSATPLGFSIANFEANRR